MSASRAYRDASGDVQIGQTVTTAQYDGLRRRIVKRVQNSADLDCTYHYYYDGQSMVETRDGSDLTIKQHVWGNLAGGYIDELVQTSINEDPLIDDACETAYYAVQGPNYNVEGLVDATGALAERYEYTPYGERQVYTSAGLNDPALMRP